MRVGIAHHLGWAVAVTADADHRVVDRRRIELVEAGRPAAPIHHEGGAWPMHQTGPPLDDDALAALAAEVRASVVRMTGAALDELADAVPDPIASISLRDWDELPADIATLRQVPHEAKADSVMYREVLADAAAARGWAVHRFTAKDVEAEAARLLGDRAHDVLHGPRAELGPPWAKDHRQALAAAVLAGAS
ncbi:MAG: hypothetical protein KF703_08330 [Actinobacteria bacterium]|nr:hypothetical protein [Actinomycetota bacterium]